MGEGPQVVADNIESLQIQYTLSNGTVTDAPGTPSAIRTVKMTMTGVVAGAGLFLAGCVAGVVVYLVLRRKAMFHAPRGWYRYARWLWAPLFVILFGLGIGYAGANLAVGHVVKKAIR